MSSTKTKNILSLDTLKTIGQGALGAMSFGAYHQFTSNKMMELNNENIRQRNEQFIQHTEHNLKQQNEFYRTQHDETVKQHKIDMNVLNEKINKLEQKEQQRWW